MPEVTESEGVLRAARSLRPLLRSHADEIEEQRRLSSAVITALDDIGAFHLQTARELGGLGSDLINYLKVIEELSRGDASSGWCAMVASESGACINAYLEREVAAQLLTTTNPARAALTVVGNGRARQSGEQYEINGRWRFASGCRHSQWLGALCHVEDADGNPLKGTGGRPRTVVCFVEAEQAQILDTWHVSGLKGTASDDFVLNDVIVPQTHACDLFGSPVDPAPTWKIPTGLRLAMSKAAAVLGIVRGAMDAALPLLERTPFAGAVPAREEARVQVRLAQAEAAIEGGRAYLYSAIENTIEVSRDRDPPLDRAEIAATRLAIVNAAHQSQKAMTILQEVTGTGAVLDTALDRGARDLNVASRHMQLQPHILEDAGRVLLGMSPKNPLF